MALSSNTRIVLVDDDADLRHLVASILERDGYDVVEAADGEEVIAMFESAHEGQPVVDLIITDIWMPRCTGLTMLAVLRERGHATPAIVLTAHVDHETKSRAQVLRVEALMGKPFSATELRRHVRRLTCAAEVREPAVANAALTFRSP